VSEGVRLKFRQSGQREKERERSAGWPDWAIFVNWATFERPLHFLQRWGSLKNW